MKRMHDKKEIEQISVDNLTTSDVVAKTVYQSQPTWECDVKSLLNATLFKDATNIYAKFVLLGNVLWIVISGNFVNGSATGAGVEAISGQSITMPDWLAGKIYRANGTNWTEAPGSSDYKDVFTASGAGYADTNGARNIIVTLTSWGAKNITLAVNSLGTHAEDSKNVIDVRIPLLII